jgi:hypothetical protein
MCCSNTGRAVTIWVSSSSRIRSIRCGGERLEVLFVKRRGASRVFVCGGTVGGQVTLPESWTDRGGPPVRQRLSVWGLADLAAVTRAIRGC